MMQSTPDDDDDDDDDDDGYVRRTIFYTETKKTEDTLLDCLYL